jgi:hypothetical protein
MIGDLISKQLIVVKADTSQAKAEIKALSAVEQKAAKDRVEAQEKHNAAMERNAQKFALYVAGAAAGWSLLSSGLKKYEERLVSMGSKGESELKRLRDMTGGLSQAQDNLQVAIGKVALAAAPAAKALGDMANELANIVGGVSSLLNQIPGGGMLGKGLSWSRRAANPMAMAGWALGEFEDRFGGRSGGVTNWLDARNYFQDDVRAREAAAERALNPASALVEGSPEWNAWRLAQMRNTANNASQVRGRNLRGFYDENRVPIRDLLGKGESILMGLGRGVGLVESLTPKKTGRGGGGEEDSDWYGSVAARGRGILSRQAGRLNGDALNRRAYERGTDLSVMDRNEIRAGAQEATEAARAWQMDESIRKAIELMDAAAQRESLLESVFGPVSEFDLYKTAWQGLEEVVSAGFSAWIDGSKSVGTAMKEALHGFAKNLAGEALLQALRHGAYALGSLAFGDMKGAAAHGISAAKWGAVAVAAGVVGKVTAPSVGGGSANANAAAGIGGGGYTGGRERNMSMTVVMGDQFAGDSPRYVARKVRRNLNMARMYADYESEGN